MSDAGPQLRRLVAQLENANRSARNSANTADRDGDPVNAARHRGAAAAYADAGKRLDRLLRRGAGSGS